MRSCFLALAFLFAGCVRDNPAFMEPGSAAPGTLGGPAASADGGVTIPSPDLASPVVAVDMAQPPDPAPPDMHMNGGGGDPADGEVACGMQSCASPAYCCLGLGTPTCTDPSATACIGGKKLACDGPEDCDGGDRCCGSPLGTDCAKICASVSTLCHDSSDCHDNDHCCPSLFGYLTCSKQSC